MTNLDKPVASLFVVDASYGGGGTVSDIDIQRQGAMKCYEIVNF